jgi:hypothetical protein
VPFIDQPLVPTAASPGAAGFTLTISGANFVSGSVVNWNGVPLPTTFVSRAQVTATVAVSNVASAGTVFVTVVNPAPGGGVSNVVFFQVATPQSAVALSPGANLFGARIGVFNAITADFNGDGKLDIAAQGFDSQDNPTLYILLGKGDGTFQSPVAYPISIIPDTTTSPIISGDFNHDGKLDVIAGLTVLLGNGDGTFQQGVTLPSSIGLLLSAGDFNGDGKLDFAGVDTTLQLTVMLGNGDGTFQAQTPIQLLSSAVYYFDAIVTADFNGDGVLDLAVNGDGLEHGGSEIAILLGNGDGTFQAPLLGGDEAQGSLGPATAADFNGDGEQDLAGSFTFGRPDEPPAQSPGLAVGLGNGAGAFTFNNYPVPRSSYSIFSGDFNADGRLDLVMDSMIALGNGNGTFQTPVIVADGTFTLAVGDFNGDGRLDLVANNSTATAFVLLQTTALLSATALVYPNPLFTGAPSAPQTTTLKNIGSAPLAISSVTIAGTNAGDFAQTNNCPSTLASNASCQISVVFTPTAGGTRTANLQVAYNATGSPQTVPLTGMGQDFSLAATGKTTATVTVTQPASYTISVTPEGGFQQTVAFTCSGTLPPHSACSVTPGSIALNGKSSAPATVTVTAVSSALTPLTSWLWTNRFAFLSLFYGALGVILLMRSMTVRSWHPQLFCGLLLLCLFASGTIMTACGVGGSSGTSTGTYHLTVTGTATSGSVTLTHSMNLTLVVQ